MESFVHLFKRQSWWLNALPLSLLLCWPARLAQATDQTFYNNDAVDYSALMIDATDFVNDAGGTFTANPGIQLNWLSSLYSGWHNTRNFTNYGDMDSTTGFRFDTQLASHVAAASFYNTANINCGNSFYSYFLNQYFLNGFYYGGYGGIYVSATNIINTGTITIGADGLGRFIGDNLDFTTGSLVMQNAFLNVLSQTNTSTIYATGQTGQNTNNWYPDQNLTAISAASSAPVNFFIYNSTPYFSIAPTTPSNVVVQMIFIQNTLTNVPYNIYLEDVGFGLGHATVEWVGAYRDPVSGLMASNYLYLNNAYVPGSSTNILRYTSPGIPSNFTFAQTATPQALGTPTPSSFPSLFGPNQPFPSGFAVSPNIYSYVNAQLIATTVGTNGLALTNLPGRFEITANKELNLSLATMSGMNYLLLKSPQNFDYDGQSQLAAPFADVYLGRTDGSLAVTNLLLPSTPFWNGNVQAWNTRWLYTNAITGMTFDYRLLLVSSQVTPSSSSYQQDFMLYSSNNIVISDTLNIFRSLSLNCTNLLLTTNGPGAFSEAGELNLLSPGMFWAASTPRLRCLTNNGAIRTVNSTVFGSAALPYLAFVNTGTVSNGNGSAIVSDDFETSGAFSAGGGSFSVKSLTATMTNGTISASGSFSSTSRDLVIGATTLAVGKSITLYATNVLTDTGVTNGNQWTLGSAYVGSGGGYVSAPGLVLPLKPASGDLLGTTIHSIAPVGTQTTHTWSGEDRGYSVLGFSNNAAIGQLLLDAEGPPPHTVFLFKGTAGAGVTNAIYVDNLQLFNQATNGTFTNNYNLTSLTFSNNLVIYYAQALLNGVSIAEKLNHGNNDHLRWVPAYAGHFSSTNLVYPPGVTNTVNTALAQSSDIDSDGDGIVNSEDATPFFVTSQLNFSVTVTNLPPLSARLQWVTIPLATNYLEFKTNLLSPVWLPLTNFVSPLPYPSGAASVGWFDPLTNGPHFYRVTVSPWLTYPF